jgi:hypothetical protein
VKRLPLRIVVLPALLAALACGGRQPETHEPTVDFNLLTPTEFGTYSNAFLAVRTLRPAWLRTRAAGGIQSQGQVWVYRDGMRYGGTDRLSAINTIEIESIRYFDGITASQRWGLGHENGVIYITSRVR